MYSFKEGLYILLLPLVVGGIFWLSSVSFSKDDSSWKDYQTFEFTAWGDSLNDSDLLGVPVVYLSDREAAKASLLVLNNQSDQLPFSHLKEKNFHLLTIGSQLPVFHRFLNYYAPVDAEAHKSLDNVDLETISAYNPVIVALNHAQENKYVIREFLNKLSKKTDVIVVNFGDYHILKPIMHIPSIVQAPNNQLITQEVTAQLLFGGAAATRGIPEEITSELGVSNTYTTPITRLSYTDPEYVGLNSDSLAKIERIVAEGIENFAMPGCQVLIAKSGNVIYHRAFGYHTYEKKRPVKESDLYDLASITKVASTTLATMKLYEDGKLNLNDPLSEYFKDPTFIPSPIKVYDTIPYLSYINQIDSLAGDSASFTIQNNDTTDYSDSVVLVARWINRSKEKRVSSVFDVPLKDLLTHTSGLQASLPIDPYKQYINSPLYSDQIDQQYTIPVAERFYMNRNYQDSIWNTTKGLRRDSSRYRYSCVNMILMQRVVDSINQQPINNYVQENFYEKLGIQTLQFNPLENVSQERIVPTASDRWRGQLLCGTVHDPTAALMGGVSGNAGLFSNANDLGILFQMFLNNGAYGGESYLNDTTIALFTAKQRGHRGFGFDKPPRTTEYIVGESASINSYGHTGFTGTCVWVDPEHDLIFVFLSNRIHPSVKNYKINQLRIRQRIHQVIYDAMGVPRRAPIRRPKKDAQPKDVFIALK